MSKLLVFPASARSTSICFIDGTLLHWRTSASGLLEEISEDWTLLTGQPTTEALSYGWINKVHPEDRDRMLRLWYCSQHNTRPFRCEFQLDTAHGDYVPGLSTAGPVFGLNGAISHWQGESLIKAIIPRQVINLTR